jgi:hypothetical protein
MPRLNVPGVPKPPALCACQTIHLLWEALCNRARYPKPFFSSARRVSLTPTEATLSDSIALGICLVKPLCNCFSKNIEFIGARAVQDRRWRRSQSCQSSGGGMIATCLGQFGVSMRLVRREPDIMMSIRMHQEQTGSEDASRRHLGRHGSCSRRGTSSRLAQPPLQRPPP